MFNSPHVLPPHDFALQGGARPGEFLQGGAEEKKNLRAPRAFLVVFDDWWENFLNMPMWIFL